MKSIEKFVQKLSARPPVTEKDFGLAGMNLRKALNNDMTALQKTAMSVQELQMSGFPTNDPKAVLERFATAQQFDLGYEVLFKKIALNAPHTSWDIYTSGTGITFEKLEAGEEIRMSRTSGSKVTASVDYYAAGFEVLQQWIENQQWFRIEEAATDFVNAYNKKKSETFYALVDAVSSAVNVAWQGVVADTTVYRDVATINEACKQIIESRVEANVPTTVAQPFVVCAPFSLMNRISDALDQIGSTGDDKNKYGKLRYNVVPVITTFLSADDKYYVAIPGEKSQMAIRKDLTAEKARNIINLSDVEVRYAAWGGAIADENQFRRCSVS